MWLTRIALSYCPLLSPTPHCHDDVRTGLRVQSASTNQEKGDCLLYPVQVRGGEVRGGREPGRGGEGERGRERGGEREGGSEGVRERGRKGGNEDGAGHWDNKNAAKFTVGAPFTTSLTKQHACPRVCPVPQ